MPSRSALLAPVLIFAGCAAPESRAPVAVRQSQLPLGAESRRLEPSAVVPIGFGFKMPDRPALEALLAAQHDPASPLFRHWITPAEFGERFGLPGADYQRIADGLRRLGLAVEESPNRLYLQAVGRAEAVEKLFGVQLLSVHVGESSWRTYRGTPTLPEGIGRSVLAVDGLDTYPLFKHRLAISGGNTFGPQDLRRYYDMAPLHAAGFTGRGSTVAALGAIPVDFEMPRPDDINYFYTHVSDSSAVFTLDVMPNPGNETYPAGMGVRQELEMDSELSTVAAPEESSVTLVLAPASDVFFGGVNHIVNALPNLTAISVSFGACEAFIPKVDSDVTANYLAQGAAEGQAWFAATGDTGADDCSQGKGPSVDFPADLEWVTGVGGTQTSQPFDGSAAIPAWASETTWNESAQGGGAGGGGASVLYPRPAWQTGPGTSGANVREEPDIALLAATNPGVAVDFFVAGEVTTGSGTSDAAPLAAGIFALLNDAVGGCRFGSPNPVLYALGAAQQGGGAPVFHDITSGNITFGSVTGPAADAGYDEATGWGSLDVAQLAMSWPPCVSDGGVDAGVPDAGAPYDPCQVLGCDAGTICFTVPEGPSACEAACDAGTTCAIGEICGSVSGFGSACVPGCVSDAGCGNGNACATCFQACVPPGNSSAKMGDPCSSSGDCPTGARCLTNQDGFPGGYCTANCNDTDPACSCDSSSRCEGNFCLATCQIDPNTGCRSGYACHDLLLPNDVGICAPACTTSAQCQGPGVTCNVPTGQCLGPNHQPRPDAGVDAGPPPPPPPVTKPEVPDPLGPHVQGCGCGEGTESISALVLLLLLGLARRIRSA